MAIYYFCFPARPGVGGGGVLVRHLFFWTPLSARVAFLLSQTEVAPTHSLASIKNVLRLEYRAKPSK